MFSLAADGKTNGRGLPNPFRLAVIMYDHFDLVGLGFPPAWIQRSWLLLGARAGGCSAIRPRIAERGPATAGARPALLASDFQAGLRFVAGRRLRGPRSHAP
jgi:hypothetical protein